MAHAPRQARGSADGKAGSQTRVAPTPLNSTHMLRYPPELTLAETSTRAIDVVPMTLPNPLNETELAVVAPSDCLAWTDTP